MYLINRMACVVYVQMPQIVLTLVEMCICGQVEIYSSIRLWLNKSILRFE